MAQDWFDQMTSGAAPAPAQPSAPGVIYGRPKTPDPYQVSKDNRSAALEDARFGMSQRDQALQEDRARREQLEWNATHNPDGSLKQDPSKSTEAQAKVGTLLTRIQGGFADITGVTARNPSAQEPGYIESIRGGLDPSGIMAAPVRALAGADRRIVADAQRDVLDALLTLGTGAAYNREQLEGQMASYFPSYGDTQDEIKVKNNRLQRLIASARAQAGPLADKLDAAVAPYMNATGSPLASNTGMTMADTPEQGIQGFRLAPDQESKLLAFAPTATSPAEILAFARGMGVEIPPEQAQQAFDYYRQGGKDAAQIDYSTADALRRAELEEQLKARGQNDPSLNSATQEIVTRGATFGLTDEAQGVIGALTGRGYENERDLGRLRQEKAADRLGGAAVPLEFLGGIIGVGAGGGQQIVQSVRQGAAEGFKSGAGLGALGGFGYGEGDQSVPNALLGAGLGGGLGAAAGAGGNALSRFVSNRRQPQVSGAMDQGAEVAKSAAEEGIPISRAIIDPSVRNQLTYLETTARGNAPVREGLARTSGAIEQRVGGLANGTARDNFSAGEQVQEAGRRFISTSKKRTDALYTRAEKLAGGGKVAPQQAIAEIDRNIAELSETPNANSALISYMQDLKTDLARDGGLSIQALRNLRTQMRGQISARNLTASDAERRVSGVLDAASGDIANGLPEGARGAYAKADQAYRERMTYIQDVVQRFIGRRDAPMSPEQTFSKLQSMAKGKGGDSSRFAQMMRALTPEEMADIGATFAEQLGRGQNGEFSPALLVTQAEKLSPRALQTIFGAEGARSLQNLVKVSRAYRDVVGNLNNSRTGVANNYKSWIGRASGVVGGVGGLASGGPVTGAAGAYAANRAVAGLEGFFDARSAKLLMNEDVTRWLASAPATTNPATINAHFKRLQVIAARNPTIAGEISSLQQRITDAARGALSGPSAANDVGQTREGPPKE